MKNTLKTRKPGSLSRPSFVNPASSLFPRSLVDDLFNQFVDSGNSQLSESTNAAMDVAETDQSFEVKMDLPGVQADDIDVQVDNNTLTVRGQRTEENEEHDENKQFHRVERYSGAFARSLVLPSSINEDETAAEFKDGVLTIVIPKTDDAKPRKIHIKN